MDGKRGNTPAMARPRLSEEQYAATRERIIEAAREILLDSGPEGITIRGVAARLGMSHMAIYTYFDSHAALMAALKQRQRARIQARIEAALRKAEEGDPAEAVREYLSHTVHVAYEHPRVFKLLWVLPPGDKEPAAHRSERMAHHLKHLSQLVELGMAQKAFAVRDPFLAAATAFSITISPLILYYSGHLPGQELRDSLVQEAMSAAMGYLAGSSAPDAATDDEEREPVCSLSDAC